MRGSILLLFTFLLPATWAFAQNDNRPHLNQRKSNQIEVEGCLYGGDGYYALTDMEGNTFRLTGQTEQFDQLINHYVVLAGSTAFDVNHPFSMSANAGDTPELQVSAVKAISVHFCFQDDRHRHQGMPTQVAIP
jgi:hypothetical protein